MLFKLERLFFNSISFILHPSAFILSYNGLSARRASVRLRPT